MNPPPGPSSRCDTLRQWLRFLQVDSHVLKEHPRLFFQQAANQPDVTEPARAARGRFETGREKRPWLRLINKPQELNPCLATLTRPGAGVKACIFSSDGGRILAASDVGTMTVWDVATGAEIATLTGLPFNSARGFSADGARLLGIRETVIPMYDDASSEPFPDYASVIVVADTASGAEVASFPEHGGGLTICALSPDGRRVVSALDDGTLKVWDAATGAEIWNLTGHTDRVSACRFSPDGKRIISSAMDGTLKIWNARNGRMISTFGEFLGAPASLAFSPDGSHILTADNFVSRNLADADSGNEETDILAGKGCRMTAVELCDGETGKKRLTLTRHRGTASACAFSPDGLRVAAGFTDGSFRLFEAKSGAELAVVREQDGAVDALSFSPDGKRLAVGTADIDPDPEAPRATRPLKVWDVALLQGSALKSHRGNPVICAFFPDGSRILSRGAHSDKQANIWDATTGRLLASFGANDYIGYCAVSPDGRFAVSATGSRYIYLWDTATGQRLDWAGGQRLPASCVVSRDGMRKLCEAEDSSLQAWDIRKMKAVATLAKFWWDLGSYGFSRDGSRAAVLAKDGTLSLIDPATGNALSVTGPKQPVRSWAFSPDGSLIALGQGPTLRIWDARDGSELSRLEGHMSEVTGCHFSPDGLTLFSLDTAGTMFLWTPRPEEYVPSVRATLDRRAEEVSCYGISFDGERLFSIPEERPKRWDTMVWPVTPVTPFSPDGHKVGAVMRSGLAIWNVGPGREDCLTWVGGVRSWSWSPDGRKIAVGASTGGVQLLSIENYEPFPPVIAPWVLRGSTSGRRRWTAGIGCPFCRKWWPISPAVLSQPVVCPYCGSHLRVTSFSIEGDWREAARQWRLKPILRPQKK